MKTIWLRIILLTLVLGLVACAPNAPRSMQTITPTDLATQTESPVPTETATPTPEFGIDMEKLHHLPAEYDHLLYRLDEFVQAPDPITDSDAFDRWWNEELIPALGPVTEREVNFYVDGLGNNYEGYSADTDMKGVDRIIGEPEFFYFQHDGVVFPVLVVNVSRFYPDVVDQTLCVALYDYPGHGFGISSLQLFQQEGSSVLGIELHGMPILRGFPIEGMSGSMIEAIGRRWWDEDNRVNFGLGQMAVRP